MNTSMEATERNRIISFLIYTFTISFGLYFLFLYSPKDRDYYTSFSETRQLIQNIVYNIILISPAIGVIITRLTTGEGFKNLWIKPNFKGNVKYYLMAWLGSVLFVAIGTLVYYVFVYNPNVTNFLEERNSLFGSDTGLEFEYNIETIDILVTLFSALSGPATHLFICLSQEWAWCGYLLPKMAKRFSPIPLILINGLICGLWYAPSMVMGNCYGTEYAGFPIVGILAMCVHCIAVGALQYYLCIKTQSCIPAILIAGVIRGSYLNSLYFKLEVIETNKFLGPDSYGLIGGCGFIIAAIIVAIVWHRNYKKETLTTHSENKIIIE